MQRSESSKEILHWKIKYRQKSYLYVSFKRFCFVRINLHVWYYQKSGKPFDRIKPWTVCVQSQMLTMGRKFPVMLFLTPLSDHFIVIRIVWTKTITYLNKYVILTSPTHIIRPHFIEIDNLATLNRFHFSQGKRSFSRFI